jgi:hypothetical protein
VEALEEIRPARAGGERRDVPRADERIPQEEREREGWDDVAERGNVLWKTLIGAGLTRSTVLTLGIARVPSGEQLATHRHERA